MIKSVNNYAISELFNIETKVVYAVPRYQREYAWKKEQWENLFDDVLENDRGYFLGTIICINQSSDTLGVQRLELVDGQQRLTTLSLLFAAIHDALQKCVNESTNSDFELMSLQRKLALGEETEQIRVKPQIQNHNQADYQAVLNETGVISDAIKLPHAGNRRIFRAYTYFQSRLAEMANGNRDGHASIKEFLDKVNDACLVKIEVGSHSDAYTLFESLNNRGMPLTPIDLIKNKLLAELEANEPDEIDKYYKRWESLLVDVGDDYAIQERFFRQYYNAFRDVLRPDGKETIATRAKLVQIYEKLFNHDTEACLNKICEAGKLYALLLSRNQDEALNGLTKTLKDLERIQGTPSHLLLLYLLDRRDGLQLTEAHLEKIVSLLVRFFVRRNLTDAPPTRDLTRLFMSIIDKIAKLSGKEIVVHIHERLLNTSASDADFREKLEGPIYDENSGVARFVLCALAENRMPPETLPDLWEMENKRSVWTVEHIFPQGANIPDCWVQMIANGDKQEAEKIRQEHVHKLGNLTMSKYNSKLGNKSFEEKRDRTDRESRWVGYKNGLHLNTDLKDAETWTVEQIDARTAKLVNQAMELFKLDGNLS